MSNHTRCTKCGHDDFNGRYCEADDPAYQTRRVPCGCKCRFAPTPTKDPAAVSLEQFARKVLGTVEAVRLAGTNPSTFAYNRAVDDALSVIRRLCAEEGVGVE